MVEKFISKSLKAGGAAWRSHAHEEQVFWLLPLIETSNYRPLWIYHNSSTHTYVRLPSAVSTCEASECYRVLIISESLCLWPGSAAETSGRPRHTTQGSETPAEGHRCSRSDACTQSHKHAQLQTLIDCKYSRSQSWKSKIKMHCMKTTKR